MNKSKNQEIHLILKALHINLFQTTNLTFGFPFITKTLLLLAPLFFILIIKPRINFSFRTKSGRVSIPPSQLADYEVGAITIAPSSNFLVSSALFSSLKLCYDLPFSFDLVPEP